LKELAGICGDTVKAAGRVKEGTRRTYPPMQPATFVKKRPPPAGTRQAEIHKYQRHSTPQCGEERRNSQRRRTRERDPSIKRGEKDKASRTLTESIKNGRARVGEVDEQGSDAVKKAEKTVLITEEAILY